MGDSNPLDREVPALAVRPGAATPAIYQGWLGRVDSNHRNNAFKGRCLTAWRLPNGGLPWDHVCSSVQVFCLCPEAPVLAGGTFSGCLLQSRCLTRLGSDLIPVPEVDGHTL